MAHHVNKWMLALIVIFLMAYGASLYIMFHASREDVVGRGPHGARENVLEPAVTVRSASESGAKNNFKPEHKVTSPQMSRSRAQHPVTQVEQRSSTQAQGTHLGEMSEVKYLTEEAGDARSQDPVGSLSIAGRVLDTMGEAVPGIKVIAMAIYRSGHSEYRAKSAQNFRREVTSHHDGSYTIDRLIEGDYQISTVATDRYSQARITARAGTDTADLIVAAQKELHVSGTVMTPNGELLDRVQISPVASDSVLTSSNAEGQFAFDIMLDASDQNLVVRFIRNGYENKEINIDLAAHERGGASGLNIIMEPSEDDLLARVSGRVTAAGGQPAVGQRVMLSSHQLGMNYQATTDPNGSYGISSIEMGDDYMVSINAAGGYKDYFQKNIHIGKSGLVLNIELESLDTGTLRGQMVDVLGAPIPGFSMVLQTVELSYYYQRVLGNELGEFVVEKAPAGDLVFKTTSNPYYAVEGISLLSGTEMPVLLVLDKGNDLIQGQVVNNMGIPVVGAGISLIWSHEENGILSTSNRQASSDAQGGFRFTQLGPGSHRLAFSAAGYKPVSLIHDVALQGSDLVVRMESQ